jgi:hypothetical protein
VKALVAISEVTKQNIKKDGDFLPIYDRLLVISVGTGSNKNEQKYNAKMASKWGAICWLYNDSHTPLIDCYSEASKDLVDFYNFVVFQALHSENNYLRVHVCYRLYSLVSHELLHITSLYIYIYIYIYIYTNNSIKFPNMEDESSICFGSIMK